MQGLSGVGIDVAMLEGTIPEPTNVSETSSSPFSVSVDGSLFRNWMTVALDVATKGEKFSHTCRVVPRPLEFVVVRTTAPLTETTMELLTPMMPPGL